MNDQLQAQLTQILSSISTSVGEFKDFSVVQLPDIVQQYITYGIWINVVTLLISGVIFITLASIAYRYFKKFERTGDDYYLMISIPSGFFALPAGAFFCSSVMDLILVKTAPKVWFILQIKDLIS